MENREAKVSENTMKYAPLRFELKRQFPSYEVTQYNIIVYVLGGSSMNKAKSIKALMGERPGSKTLRKCRKVFSHILSALQDRLKSLHSFKPFFRGLEIYNYLIF